MCCLSVVSSFRPMGLYCFALLYLPFVLGSSAVDLLLHFEYYIIFSMLFFQLKTSLKLRKREFYCSKFSCLTKIFFFSVKSKHKKNHDEYYIMFKIQNSNISKSTDELPRTLDKKHYGAIRQNDEATKKTRMRQKFVYFMVVTFGIFMNLKQKQQ